MNFASAIWILEVKKWEKYVNVFDIKILHSPITKKVLLNIFQINNDIDFLILFIGSEQIFALSTKVVKVTLLYLLSSMMI